MSNKSELLDLVITRIIDAPLLSVWKAWSEPEQLIKWWCPKPWSTKLRGFDLRSGGVFDTLMRGPNGEESSNPGLFLEVVPGERIVFTSALREGWRPAPRIDNFLMTAIITMKAAGDKTHYTATVLHPDEATSEQHKEMGFFEGWGICIDQLEALAQELTKK